jgi:hypothetical protein
VKSPKCYRFSNSGLSQWSGLSNVTLTVGPSTKSRCKEASARCLDVRAAKNVSTGSNYQGETSSSYLRPNPKFCPKSAARLAVGEEPLIGNIVK